MFSSLFTLHISKWSVLSSSIQNIVLYLCKEQGRVKDIIILSLFVSNLTQDDHQQPAGFLNEAKEWAGELLSGQTKVSSASDLTDRDGMVLQAGKVLNGVVFVISICSQLTYFYDAQQGLLEKCLFSFPVTLQVNCQSTEGEREDSSVLFLVRLHTQHAVYCLLLHEIHRGQRQTDLHVPSLHPH